GYGCLSAHRRGKPRRPDVALAFDRLDAAARADGVSLTITSAYRSDAEQAELFARHPDPHWVARPGTSLHRYATELDLGPPSAYAWLEGNSERFHFIRRYAWEPWHFGYALNPQSRPAKHSAPSGEAAGRGGASGAPSGEAAGRGGASGAPSGEAAGRGGAAGARGGSGTGGTDRANGPGDGVAGIAHGSVPDFVPAQFAPMLTRAAQRWNVS